METGTPSIVRRLLPELRGHSAVSDTLPLFGEVCDHGGQDQTTPFFRLFHPGKIACGVPPPIVTSRTLSEHPPPAAFQVVRATR